MKGHEESEESVNVSVQHSVYKTFLALDVDIVGRVYWCDWDRKEQPEFLIGGRS